MQYFMTPYGVPIFWENGNIYYIFKDKQIGTYTKEGYDDHSCAVVYNRKGIEVGTIMWESVRTKTTGSLAYKGLYDALDDFDHFRGKVYKEFNAETDKEKYKVFFALYASDKGIMNEKTGECIIREFGMLGPNGQFLSHNQHQMREPLDAWGMMSSFVCWNEFDVLAPYHGYYTFDREGV